MPWSCSGSCVSFLYLAKIPDVSRGYMIVLMGVLLAGAVGVRFLVRSFFERARVRGKNVRSVLVLGTGPQGRELRDEALRPSRTRPADHGIPRRC